MEVDPQSPRVQVGGLESPSATSPSTSPKCPNAPMKPWLSRQHKGSDSRFEPSVSDARDALEAMETTEARACALQGLPRHTLQGVFLAYCKWQTGHSREPFEELLAVVADLDNQILAEVQRCCPSLSWDAWTQQVQQAALEPAYGQQLAEQFVQMACYSMTRRTLCF